MLPILGIIDLFFKPIKIKKGWWITLFSLLWELVYVYLNSPPVEPRERDYVYVGSFYAFSLFDRFGNVCHSRS
jgi:hypothetical protein